jgi:hypothetical protein
MIRAGDVVQLIPEIAVASGERQVQDNLRGGKGRERTEIDVRIARGTRHSRRSCHRFPRRATYVQLVVYVRLNGITPPASRQP